MALLFILSVWVSHVGIVSGYILHIGVGFCVARFDIDGQCETPLAAGRVTGTATRAFSFYVPNHK